MKHSDNDGAELLPSVSVILPIRNEEQYIERTLNSVFNQDYPSDQMEVLAVDGRSDDATREIVSRLQQKHSNLRLLDNPGRIQSVALNVATAEARGDIIVRVDGHCQLEPDFLRCGVRHLQRDDIGGVGGPIETVGETFIAGTIAVAMSSPFGVGNSTFRTTTDKGAMVDCIPFPAYKRQVIEKAGPYNEEYPCNEDNEYSFRMRRLGVRLLLAPDVRSRYFCRNNLRKLSRQYFRYGYWKVPVMQTYPSRMRLRHFVPSLFVISLATTLIVSPAFPWSRWLFLLIVGLYGTSSLFFSQVAARKHNWLMLPLLPIVYFVLHSFYGIGFLFGLFVFWNRWSDRRRSLPELVAQPVSAGHSHIDKTA